jgi:hypothetical protein
MMNLIINAADAMSTVMNRQRLLRLRTQAHEPGGLLITVEDTGSGIDPRHADRIFEPFFTTKSQGMGMGLSICRSIVENHGGHLSVAPGRTHGSTFSVFLPTAPPVAAAAGGRYAIERRRQQRSHHGGLRRRSCPACALRWRDDAQTCTAWGATAALRRA